MRIDGQPGGLRVANAKMPRLFAFARHVEMVIIETLKSRSTTLMKMPDTIRHDGNIGVFGRRNPPCNAEDKTARRTHRH